MNHLSNIEYVALRMVRRFVFTEALAVRFARWLPYYATNVGESNPDLIVERYSGLLSQKNVTATGLDILEVGSGRTNAVGYGLAALGAGRVYTLEPYVQYDAGADQTLLANNQPAWSESITIRVERKTAFSALDDASVDVILSSSVLEHVADLGEFFSECRRVLKPGGCMLHLVDYRDHFFKYPYAFLTFSDRHWNQWLNPGDLPRWRLYDHKASAGASGFDMEILEKATDTAAFGRIEHRLDARFDRSNPDVAVTFAAIFCSLPVESPKRS